MTLTGTMLIGQHAFFGNPLLRRLFDGQREA